MYHFEHLKAFFHGDWKYVKSWAEGSMNVCWLARIVPSSQVCIRPAKNVMETRLLKCSFNSLWVSQNRLSHNKSSSLGWTSYFSYPVVWWNLCISLNSQVSYIMIRHSGSYRFTSQKLVGSTFQHRISFLPICVWNWNLQTCHSRFITITLCYNVCLCQNIKLGYPKL